MTRRFGYGVLLALLSLVLAGGSLVRAQESTPTGGTIFLPVTPDPSECTVTAPTVDEVIARVSPMMASPVATPAETAFTLPDGIPADAATVVGITEVLREVLACINTGNFLTITEFSTDQFLVQLFSGGDEGEDDGTPAPDATVAPEFYASLTAVHDVVMLPDGRVGALVETIFPDEEPGVQVDYFFFAQQDGRWLLDGIVEDLEGQFPPVSGTPVAS